MKPSTIISVLIAAMFVFLFSACDRSVGNNQNNNQNNGGKILYTMIYPEGEINIFSHEELMVLELENTALEAVRLEQLAFYISEPYTWDIEERSLSYPAGQIDARDTDTAGVFFQWSTPVILNPGEKIALTLRATFMSGVCKESFVTFLYTNTENRAFGVNSAEKFGFYPSANPEQGTNTRLITGNALSFDLAEGSPSDGYIFQNAEDSSMLVLSLFAGEDMTINSYTYKMYLSGGQTSLDDFRVWGLNGSGEWVVVGGPFGFSDWDCTSNYCEVKVEDRVDIRKCEETVLSATLDIGNTEVNSQYRLVLDKNKTSAVSGSSDSPVPREHILGHPEVWGPLLTVHTQTVVP